MIGRCVNSECNAPLHSLLEGRLFQFEVISISVSANDDQLSPQDETPQTQTAQFWLCQNCGRNMSLTLDPMSGLKLVPRDSGNSDVPAIRNAARSYAISALADRHY